MGREAFLPGGEATLGGFLGVKPESGKYMPTI